MKKYISAGNLPFSKAVIYNGVMEISGQVGINPGGKLEEGIEGQTRRALDNIKAILEENGWSFDNLVKVRIYLVDMKDYAKVNEIYAEYFSGKYPSRVALAVKELPMGALIEIEGTASGEQVKN